LVVFVDKSAEQVAAFDGGEVRSPDCCGWFGRVECERAVWAFAVVMGRVDV
jgi:hypothetical protein